MREIKFRFWDKEEKEWLVDGGPDDSYENDIYDFAFMKGNNWVYISREEARKRVEVIQYTGLKDINGKEIYEGDICEISNDVYYSNRYFNTEDEWEVVTEVIGSGYCFRFRDVRDKWAMIFLLEAYEEGMDIEVIGNIYENPELLEVEKNAL